MVAITLKYIANWVYVCVIFGGTTKAKHLCWTEKLIHKLKQRSVSLFALSCFPVVIWIIKANSPHFIWSEGEGK